MRPVEGERHDPQMTGVVMRVTSTSPSTHLPIWKSSEPMQLA